jgi:beta-mannanase
VPSCGAWWGVAANPLGSETWDQALTNFETEIGRSVDVAHFYKKSPELFPWSGEIARAHDPAHPRILLINWKPQGDRTWAQVAAGAVDTYIDKEAAYLKKNFTDKFFLAIHHEPEMDVNPAQGSGMTAKDYAAMFRHVVERLRGDGVTNAVYVLNYLGTPNWGSQPWFNDLYPGDDVVDWIAQDPYVIRGSEPWWTTTFGSAVDRKQSSLPQWPGFYSWAKQYHPDRPIMLAEWGVDEQPSEPEGKAEFFRNQMVEMQQYPNIKALVYWNSVPFHPVGITRVDSSQPALDAYRKLSDVPFLNQPIG